MKIDITIITSVHCFVAMAVLHISWLNYLISDKLK